MINLFKRLLSRDDLPFYDAVKILDDVPAGNRFWCCDGQVLSNLYELEIALDIMSDEEFSHHVNEEKNDFSNWIKDIIGDEKLADDLVKTKSRKKAAKRVGARIQRIESITLL